MIEGLDVELRGWVLAFVGGVTLVGKVVSDCDVDAVTLGGRFVTLAPVFELSVTVQATAGGKGRVVHACAPVAYLESWSLQQLPPGTSVKPCAELDRRDREQIEQALREGDRVAGALRAAKLGLVTASRH